MAPYRNPRARRRGGVDDRRVLRPPREKAPPVPSGVDWPEHVRAWWRRVWRSPVAGEWDLVVDLESVRRLGDLYAQLDRGDAKAALHAQAAKLEGELLLTPAARKRAYVRLPAADDPVEPDPTPRGRPARERLRVVEPPEEDPRRLLGDGA